MNMPVWKVLFANALLNLMRKDLYASVHPVYNYDARIISNSNFQIINIEQKFRGGFSQRQVLQLY
jgi:hypothetical protein